MKWIGQHIYDLVSRFRDDVYLEDISSGTIASGGNLGLDSNNKIVKQDDAGITDLHGAGVDGSANQLLTDDGDGTITSEANLTFDGNDLTIGGDLQVSGGNIIGTTDSDIQIDSDDDIILNVDNDGDASNQMIKFADNGTDVFKFNVGKGITEIETATPSIKLTSTVDSAVGNHFYFTKQRIDSTTQIGEAGDDIGTISWIGYNDGTPALKTYATMLGEIADPVTGAEAGNLTLAVASYDGVLTNGLQLLGDTNADGEVDVDIASGAASTTTIAGTLTMGSTAAMTNAGLVAVANQSSITGLGTISSGVWNGTAVASAYLDADTAHLTTAQTFTGSKTMGTTTKFNFRDGNSYIYSPTANDLEIVATDITLDAAGDIALEAGGDDITLDADYLKITSSTSNRPEIHVISTNDNTLGGDLWFKKNRNGDGTANADNDFLGNIYFTGYDDAGTPNTQTYAHITAQATDVTSGQEAGRLRFSVAEYDGTNTVGLQLDGDTNADGEIDVTIASGAASTTTVAGNLTVTSKLTCASRTLAVSSSTDGDHDGDVVYFGGTTSMTIGKIYHYKSDGTWEIVNADAVSTSDGLLGVALGAASDTNGMLLRGMVTLDHDPGAIGDVLFVQSDNAGTPGNATATAPSASGDCVRIIGYQVSHASNGNIWFNPDNTFVEVA